MKRYVLVALWAACGTATPQTPASTDGASNDTASVCVTDDDCGAEANRCVEHAVCDSGQCVVRPAVVCDGVVAACHALTCEPITGLCVEALAEAACDDGDACTVSDVCTTAGACHGTARTCDDGNDCTVEACDPERGCTLAVADDGAPCVDSCLEAPTCVAGLCSGAPATCDDGLPCTADTCVAGLGCVSTPAPLVCDDGDPCTSDDRCATGICAGLPVATGTPCDDGDPCTSGEACATAGCAGAAQASCASDGNPCTSDSCQPGLGCLYPPVEGGAACSDPALCLQAGHCVAGACSAPVVVDGTECAPAQPCRGAATCDGGVCLPGLVATAGAPCKATDACLTAAACDATGSCMATETVECDDHNPCTADGCSVATGCVHTPVGNGAACVGPCGLVGVCNGTTCLGSDPCEGFGGLCEVWTCASTGGCVPAGLKADGAACGTACQPASCSGGACLSGKPVDCFAGNACVISGCDNVKGCQVLANANGFCNADDDACTLLDTCSAGVCSPGNGCDDFEACTFDACEAGKCNHTWDPACGGESVCTDGVDDDGGHGVDCLDRSCERSEPACVAAHPVPWVVDIASAGLGTSAGPGLTWSSATADAALRLDVATGGATFEVMGSATVCCVDGASTTGDLWLTFAERVSLPGGPGCAVEPDSFVVRTVQLEAPFTSTGGGPLNVVHSSYHVLPDDGCGAWRTRAVRISRAGIDSVPTPGSLRVRFLARVQTVASVGSWEIDAVRLVEPEDCTNGGDDNGDLLVDCDDPVCASEAVCSP